MQTEAVFENIATRIQSEIRKAHKSVFVAVAWFTNKNIFNELLNKAKEGCTISLIISNDAINSNSQIAFELLEEYNSNFFKVGNGDSELMHNKFCVIDFSTVITGSYNWSYRAESNFENVIINYNDTALAEQFIAEFNQIRKQFYPDEPETDLVFPLTQIIRRLEVLKNYILLEDVDELVKESTKLHAYSFNTDLAEIIEAIQQKKFSSAITKIQTFIAQNSQLVVWSSPEIAALKLEIKNLENKLNAFDNEKLELEKLLSEFHYRHTQVLGSIILEILKLRKLKFKFDKEKLEEVENDYNQYSKHFSEEKGKQQFELTDNEKQELKIAFRKATFLCHPDKVNDAFKEDAQRVFIELKTAYEANDLKRVMEILNNLEQGNFFKSISETVSEIGLLKAAIVRLRTQIKTLESEISMIKDSETFKTITTITDWDVYFKLTKEQLEKELKELQIEIDA